MDLLEGDRNKTQDSIHKALDNVQCDEREKQNVL